ncbi:MAG: NAD(P)-binding domain-containing protein [SAR86 cluster bacterium]|uniref:Glutamyl-tRNA reductase n=1 Tax=SAR86 cluster bacterium TaxID=2030880 RepID=A0A937IGD5_9GAMM|nr:NAD(P)-binding domain-containing protein [SAR86 cluster bacterium]
MNFQCWGLSHKSTSLEVREKFAFNKEEINKILINLKDLMPFESGVFLSTCNRTEFYTFCKRAEVKNFETSLKKAASRKINIRKNDQYLYTGVDAFKHLLKVMTGLDSMIVGEPDIFGQVKKAYQNSKEHSYLDKSMENMFTSAIRLSKKIRTSAKLSRNPISIASVVDNEICKDCSRVMIIGAGDIAQALLPRLIKKNIEISLFNRTSTEVNNIKSKSLKNIKNDIAEVDAIVIAAPSENPFFNNEALKKVSKRLQIFDLAIPRNINFKITGMDIELLNLDELSEKITINLDSRKVAVNEAQVFIDANAEAEYSRIKGLSSLKSQQKNIKEKLRSIKEQALEEAKHKIKSGKDIEDVLDDLAHEINSKDLFHISKALEQGLLKARKS